MSRILAVNALGLVLTLGASLGVLRVPGVAGSVPREVPEAEQIPAARSAPTSTRHAALVDHQGLVAPERHYARIVAASTVADTLLLELCSPERILAFTAYGAGHRHGQKFGGKPLVKDASDVEAMLAMQPDLVLVSSYVAVAAQPRLREAGITVFDLGPMRGMATLIPNVRQVARLVEAEDEGEALVRRLENAMRGVAADVAAERRKRGMYLSGYSGRLFGGGRGTSYDDVLAAAGLLRARPEDRDWPELSAEQVLSADPDVIVTQEGMEARLCEMAGLRGLRACREGGVVGVDDAFLGDPGLGMPEAADAVRAKVYGAKPTLEE